MSFNKNNNTSRMAKIMGMLRQMSTEKNGDQKQRGSESRLRGLASGPGKGYARVPSKGTISASTTSTSLVTDYTGSHPHLPRGLFPHDFSAQREEEYLEEEEQASREEERSLTGAERDAGLEPEDYEQIRQHFQQKKQISLGGGSKYKMEMEIKGAKDENLRSAVPYVEALSEMGRKKDFKLEMSPYNDRPTTQKIYIMTQILAAVAVSLGSLVVGYCTAYTSPALTTMIHENSTIRVTKQEGSWVGGLMPLAALMGGVIGGPLIEHFGRRNTILAISFPFIASWLVIATAANVSVVYVGRIIGGLCVGVGSLSFPVYLGEIVQAEFRGQLGLLPTAFGNVGILICFVAGKYLDWSNLAYLGAALPIPFVALMMLIPETPRWLVARERREDARDSLRWLRGKEVDVKDELEDIVKSYNEAEQNATGSATRELFKKEHSRAVLICLGLMFFQQLSGINAVIFYTVSIFKDAGSTIDENLSTIIVGIVNFGSTFVATILIERLGRKKLLFMSGSLMIVTLMTLGTFFYLRTIIDVSDYGWVPLASFVVYVIGFSLGFGPIPWLMMGEILPGRIRSTAASVATAFNWSCTFLVTKTFQDIIDAIGTHGTFWLFGIICMFGLAFTFIWVPETKGKTLEEIEKKLSGRKSRPDPASIVEKVTIDC